MSRSYIDPRFRDEVRGRPLAVQCAWYALLMHPYGQLVPGIITCYDRDQFAAELGVGDGSAQAAYADLMTMGLLLEDRAVRIIRLPRAPLYFPKPGNTNIRGWWRHWQTVSESPLKYDHIESLRRACDLRGNTPAAEAWRGTFGALSSGSVDLQYQQINAMPLFNHTHRSPLDGGSILQDQDQECDQDRDQDHLPDPERVTAKIIPDQLAARRLWELQERLRAGIPGLIAKPPTTPSLQRVETILARGVTPDQCTHVLEAYANHPEWHQYFDGVSNWEWSHFERAMGRPRQPSSNGANGSYYKPTASDATKFAGGRVRLS